MPSAKFHHYKDSPLPGCDCFECLASEFWLGGLIPDDELEARVNAKAKTLEAVNICLTKQKALGASSSGSKYSRSISNTKIDEYAEKDENIEISELIEGAGVNENGEASEDDENTQDKSFNVDLQERYLQNLEAAVIRRGDARSMQREADQSMQDGVTPSMQQESIPIIQQDSSNEPTFTYGTGFEIIPCDAFNTETGCTDVPCKLTHICSACYGIGHGATKCWYALNCNVIASSRQTARAEAAFTQTTPFTGATPWFRSAAAPSDQTVSNHPEVDCQTFNKFPGCVLTDCVRRHACNYCHEVGHSFFDCWRKSNTVCPLYNSYWGCGLASQSCPREHICRRCRSPFHPAYKCSM